MDTFTFKVGKRSCTASTRQEGLVTHIDIEWDPNVPKKLSKGQMRQYVEGRDAALRQLLHTTGIPIHKAKVAD